MNKVSVLVAAATACTVSASTLAQTIISNHPGNDATQTAGINATTRTKGMGFTMPGGLDYTLDSVTLRLDLTTTDVSPRIEIYSDAGGVPGSSLTTLVNPGSFGLGIGDYAFTPASSFTLEAGQNYWIIASSTLGTYSWKASSPAETPTGLATHLGATFGAYPASGTSGILTTYFVDATVVPAPGSLALLGLAGLAVRRRR